MGLKGQFYRFIYHITGNKINFLRFKYKSSYIHKSNKITVIDKNGISKTYSAAKKYLPNITLSINGRNNSIIIKEDLSTKFKNINISIQGNDNEFVLQGHLNNIEINSYSNKMNFVLNKNILLQHSKICVGFEDIEVNNAKFEIGENTIINGINTYIFEHDSKINIGKNCQFSWGIDLWCSDSHSIMDVDKQLINKGEYIIIGDNTWVCKDVRICKNTKIPKHTIVGLGSIVTNQFTEENTVIAGNPAKIVKRGVFWNITRPSQYIPPNSNTN